MKLLKELGMSYGRFYSIAHEKLHFSIVKLPLDSQDVNG